jgi:HlyD family secretion protein
MTPVLPAWQVTLDAEAQAPSLRRTVAAAVAVITLGFGGFAAWAFTAPLDSAVPAMGSVVVESKRKTVSLLESGILKDLLVREGDHVAEGQPLLKLDDTQARAQLGQGRAQFWAARSKLARLVAETTGAAMAIPPDLQAAAGADPALAVLVANEQRLLDTRMQTLKGSLAVQDKRINQFNQQIAAIDAQTAAARTRLGLIDDQLKTVVSLLEKGLAQKSRARELEGTKAELQGSIGELAAKRAEAQQNIAQTELEMSRIHDSWQADVGRELQDTQGLLADLSERLRAAEDVLAHKLVTAPAAGTVTDIKFATPGSSIIAGQPVLDVVPDDGRLLVEANVQPNDIEHVHLGQKVNVRLISYKQHKVPVLTGKLAYVSADRQIDAKGEPFFVARVELTPGALDRLKGVKLYPGMPAEVLIIGGERVAIDYFLAPITDSLNRAFREE